MYLKMCLKSFVILFAMNVYGHEVEGMRTMHTSEDVDHIHLRPYLSQLNVDVLKESIENRVTNLFNISNLMLGHIASGYNSFTTGIQFNANYMSLDVDIPTQTITCTITPTPLTREAARLPFVPTVLASDMIVIMSDCSSENIGFFSIDFNLSELGMNLMNEAYETGKQYVNVRAREEMIESTLVPLQ